MASKSARHKAKLAKDHSLSPRYWNTDARLEAEQQQALGWTATRDKALEGLNGAICAVASPIAVQAGLKALHLGGTAADAAATIALTQCTTEIGSVVSHAGAMSLVYYLAAEERVYSMDAGYNSYKAEEEPLGIPVCDLGPLNAYFRGDTTGDDDKSQAICKSIRRGRETLVPGFMAGIEAMHRCFGTMPFASLFQPAVWYAERGVALNPTLEHYFSWRYPFFERTVSGQAFLRQAGTTLPKSGEIFYQKELGKTLRGVARLGAQYMYTGSWGKHFVRAIQEEGGKVTPEDMRDYKVIWSEPFSTTFCGHKIFTAGPPNCSAYNVLTALNIAENLALDRRPSYWLEPSTLRELTRISYVTEGAPRLRMEVAAKIQGIDFSPANQLSKEYARAIAPLLDQIIPEQSLNEPRHSNSIVVVDRHGNIAALTHTINTVCWGDTGIVVQGVPIPDPAGFQQARLASIKPGERLPHEMSQTIVIGKTPLLATAAIGSSMLPETIRIILGVIGGQLSLNTIQAAPPIICNFGSHPSTVVVPEGAYELEFLQRLQNMGMEVKEITKHEAAGLRGTVAAVGIDSGSGLKKTVESNGGMLFAATY